jgi:MarR family transcriptional regulator, organic hydroperoxide resistance regulator
MSMKVARIRQQERQARSTKPPLTVGRPQLLVNGSDDEFRRLVHGLFAYHAIHTSIRDGYADIIGVGGQQYTILLCIRHLAASEPVSVRIIADHLRLSGSFITVETNRLEAMGLVRKERQTGDRRMLSLKLTARGNALLDSIAPLRRQVNDIQFGALSSSEFRHLVGVIYRLIDSGDKALSLLHYLKENRPLSAAE